MQNFRPKKSLGQNFLIDRNIALKIVRALSLKPYSSVFEIGAGTGALTRDLLDTGALVFAIEIDKRLCQVLRQKFGDRDNFRLLEADILKIDLAKYPFKKKATLVGNIPFYISSQIIIKFLPHSDYIDKLYVTIQKELAQRMVSAAGSRQSSTFSLFVHFFARAKILFRISKTCFRPIPKVDACFVELSLRQTKEIKDIDTESLFSLIKCAFSQRRKTLFNTLRNSYNPNRLKQAFNRTGIDSRCRPEAITLEEYIRLMNSLKQEFL